MKWKSKRRRRKNKILWVLMICIGISAITICAAQYQTEFDTVAGEISFENASSVGIAPGRLENQDDSFVPVKTLRKVEEIELMSLEPDKEVLKEYERQQRLLEIPGVMISDTEVRSYPLKDAAAHLVGYVQNVTAEG